MGPQVTQAMREAFLAASRRGPCNGDPPGSQQAGSIKHHEYPKLSGTRPAPPPPGRR